jgi:UDP-N-acetylmuramoyl-tripeptide--D-alanyl-D-alanine ligase
MSDHSPILSTAEVLKATGGVSLSGLGETKFYGITTDSRQVSKGNLFIALTGDKFDGHDFIEAAVTQGAAGILIDNEAKINPGAPAKGVVVIKVADTMRALGDLAKYYRSLFLTPVIGLTGSSGKTTTKEMMAAIMGIAKNVLKTEGNLNNLIGLPQTIFRLTSEHQVAILEMGTNTRGEIKRLTEIAAPTIGLITNIGPAHLAGFGSLNVVQEEKGDLFLNMSASGTAVINQDDEAIRSLAEKWPGKRITFGMGFDADVTVTDVKKNGARGVCFNLQIGDQVQKVEIKCSGCSSHCDGTSDWYG